MAGAQVGVDVVLSQRSYFAGDRVQCRIYFYFGEEDNSSEPEAGAAAGREPSARGAGSGGQAHRSGRSGPADHPKAQPPVRMLEWATVQLHGHVAFDPHLVSPRDAAAVAEEAEAGYDPDARAKRLQQAHESGILHRAESSMCVLSKSKAGTQVGRHVDLERGRAAAFRDGALTSLDPYDESQAFLSEACAPVSGPSMPDVTLLAGKFGNCLFASPAEVLTCAYRVKAGTEVAFAFESRLPNAIPPSYTGSAARYFYALTIGCKINGRETAHVVHVPLRVCSTIGAGGGLPSPVEQDVANGQRRDSRLRSFSSFLLEKHDFETQSWVLGQTNFRRRTRTHRAERFNAASLDIPLNVNPQDGVLRVVDLDSTGLLAKERANSLHSGRAEPNASSPPPSVKSGQQVFRIGSESRLMAHLHIFKDTVVPGDALLLAFDFDGAAVPCYQVTVALETEERSKCPPPLQAAFEPLTAFDSSSAGGHKSFDDPKTFGLGPWTRVLTSRTVQVAFTKRKSITLPVPVDAIPDFETDLIAVKSFLRFEFVTGKTGEGAATDTGKSAFLSVRFPIENRGTQTSPWRIPLRIAPPEGFFLRKETSPDTGILLLSSSTQPSMLHVRVWL